MKSTDATLDYAAPASAASLDDPRLMRAMEEYAELLRTGPRPDRAEFLARHADIADALGRCLDSLEFVHDAGQNLGCSGADGPIGTDLLRSGVPLGDYQLIRELGRGGMGIVYEAEQLSLGRRVALKVLPYAATMDAKQLQRFKNEARAAAGLHHEHIVPVYGVGCERGVHYYAMQLIEGQTLAQLMHDLFRPSPAKPGEGKGVRVLDTPLSPSPLRQSQERGDQADTAPIAFLSTERSGPRGRAFFRTAAELIAQAADALEHAHSLGIVHRDVKPANLMVDVGGKLWVTDFGLARLGPDAGLTASNDLLGTLRYMAPEQALAKHGLVDHRADIYALGAALYELLTGRSAADADERADILRQIAFDEPARPRKLDRSIPAELELIALKCLAKDPAERYATAGDLADDLRRFAEDKPIRARRPTVRQRLGHLARRYPAATALVSLTAGLLLAGAWGWERQQAQAEATARAVDQQAAEYQAAGRYVEALAVAQRAVDLLPRFGDAALRRQLEERVADLDLLHDLDEARLEGAVVKDDGSGFDSARLARAIRQVFLEHGVDALGGEVEAVAEQLRHRAIRAEITAAVDEWSHWAVAPAERQRLRQLTDALDPEGIGPKARQAAMSKDVEALKRLAAEAAVQAPPQLLFRLAATLEEFSAWDAVERLLRAGLRRYPSDFWLNQLMSKIMEQRSKRAKNDASARELAAEVLNYDRITLALRPHSAGVWLNVGFQLSVLKRYEEAETAYRQAIELKPDYVRVHVLLAEIMYRTGRNEESIEFLRGAIKLQPDYAWAHKGLGISLDAVGRFPEAEAAFRDAIRLQPDDADSYQYLGVVLSKTGRQMDALEAFRRALELKPGSATAHKNLGFLLRQLGQFAESLAELRRAHDLSRHQPGWQFPSAEWVRQGEQLVELEPKVPALLSGEAQPTDTAEQIALAKMCQEYKKLYATAARLFAAAFAAEPKFAEDMDAQHRYNAACAAALAGCGQGADADQLDDAERTRLRRQALDWLTADLAAWAKLAEQPAARPQLRQTLQHWQQDSDFNGVRGDAALAKLPGAERADWQKLWAGVVELLKRTAAPQTRQGTVPPP